MRIVVLILCLLAGNAYAWLDDDPTTDADIWEQGGEYDADTRKARAELGLIERIDIPLEKQPITKEGVDALTKQATAGDADAQWRLCTVYFYGRAALYGVGASWEKALYWCQRGAEQGNARAQYWLARVYADNIITDITQISKYRSRYTINQLDRNKMLYWLTRGAEQGDYRAQHLLGLFYGHKVLYRLNLVPEYLEMPERAQMMLKFKWVCLGWERMPSEHWLKKRAKKECEGNPSDNVSQPELVQIQRIITEYSPKSDMEAKSIADAMIPLKYRKEEELSLPDDQVQEMIEESVSDQQIQDEFLRHYRIHNMPE